MPVGIKINFNGKRIRIGNYSLATGQMLKLGSFANKTVIERTRSGVGSDDAPFPPLSRKSKAIRINASFVRRHPGYAAWKAAHGLQPIRDMWGDGKQGGHMLENSSVRYADENSVKIAFTSRWGRIKAHANELRTPFYSFSAADTKKIMDYASKLWQSNVQQVFNQFRGKAA
jgi:hypothetical protein